MQDTTGTAAHKTRAAAIMAVSEYRPVNVTRDGKVTLVLNGQQIGTVRKVKGGWEATR